MSHGDSHARDSQTRQVAAIFRTLHHYDEGLFVYMAMLPTISFARIDEEPSNLLLSLFIPLPLPHTLYTNLLHNPKKCCTFASAS